LSNQDAGSRLSYEPIGQCAHMQQLGHFAFGREVLRKVTNVIQPLNDRGTGTAFYCVHSITGSITDFRSMAQMLGSERKFYGVQAPTKKRNAEFPDSIESISRYYVERLIEFQPRGNFVLGGHSVGAVIAFEMAHQLCALEREVSLLVVFDGELFNTGTEISAYSPLYWFKLIWNVPAWIRDFLMVEFTFRAFCTTVVKKTAAAYKTFAAKVVGKNSAHAVEGFINLKNCTPDHADFMKVLFETQFKYVPKPYSGRVLVCAAKTQALTHLRQLEGPWRKVAPNFEIVHFEGTHTSLMRAPKGFAVAEYLARQFAKIDAELESPAISTTKSNVARMVS
jgi:thioesterase domain-containing protein